MKFILITHFITTYFFTDNNRDEEDIELIEGAIKEYHQNTCLRFRHYQKTDNDYITIEGKRLGCWSLVGRHEHGQVVNLQNPGCMHHGVIVHEFMHAVGFYHQQSAANRDEWVTINWKNIKPGELLCDSSRTTDPSSKLDRFIIKILNVTTIFVAGKEHNFNKYDNRTVTDYGIGYDYASVMHYSSHAFSKNDEPTITPKVRLL